MFLFDPFAGVVPKTYYEQNQGDYWRAHLHRLIWQGDAYELWYKGELFEDRHWREYQQRLDGFYETGLW